MLPCTKGNSTDSRRTREGVRVRIFMHLWTCDVGLPTKRRYQQS